jgi:hypothetical protein
MGAGRIELFHSPDQSRPLVADIANLRRTQAQLRANVLPVMNTQHLTADRTEFRITFEKLGQTTAGNVNGYLGPH